MYTQHNLSIFHLVTWENKEKVKFWFVLLIDFHDSSIKVDVVEENIPPNDVISSYNELYISLSHFKRHLIMGLPYHFQSNSLYVVCQKSFHLKTNKK